MLPSGPGVTIDGGTVESPVLLRLGKKQGNKRAVKNDPANPTTFNDVYWVRGQRRWSEEAA
jgi:hypothetical protein